MAEAHIVVNLEKDEIVKAIFDLAKKAVGNNAIGGQTCELLFDSEGRDLLGAEVTFQYTSRTQPCDQLHDD